jgi:hypothetical protein
MCTAATHDGATNGAWVGFALTATAVTRLDDARAAPLPAALTARIMANASAFTVPVPAVAALPRVAGSASDAESRTTSA